MRLLLLTTFLLFYVYVHVRVRTRTSPLPIGSRFLLHFELSRTLEFELAAFPLPAPIADCRLALARLFLLIPRAVR